MRESACLHPRAHAVCSAGHVHRHICVETSACTLHVHMFVHIHVSLSVKFFSHSVTVYF